MCLTQKQIDTLAKYDNDYLERYVEELERRILDDKVVVNVMDTFDRIEVVNKELDRRKEIQNAS